MQERRTGPPTSPDQQLTAERYERYELSPADDERVDAALADLLGLPAAITIRAAHEAEPSVRDHDSFASGLVSGIAANRLRFLDVELNLGNTLLDLASVTRISASRARRVARAWETHDEVARALARGDHPAFTAAEQEGLEDGLARLRSRLDAFG